LHQTVRLPLFWQQISRDLFPGIGDRHLGKGDDKAPGDGADRTAKTAHNGAGKNRQQQLKIGKGFERLMDAVSGLFSKSKKSHLKTVYKRKKGDKLAGHTKKEFSEFNNQKQIDIILDKISKSGYESLSKSEKEFLFKAGKK